MQLVNIQEEREEEDGYNGGSMNPNEPPESPKGRQRDMEEQKMMSLSMEGFPVKKSHGGIRSLKQMFSILKEDERKQQKEPEEESSSEDNASPCRG